MKKKTSRNTKGKIVSAAWQLFYRQGYDDTTIDEIVEASGRGTTIPPSTISFTNRARRRAPSIIISREKTLCSVPFHICLTRNMRN